MKVSSAISSELSLELLFDVHVLLRFEIDRLNVHYIRKKSDCIVCREVSFERIYCDIPFCCSDRPICQYGQPLSVPHLAHPRHGAARREVAAQPVQSGAACASDALSRHGRRSDGLLRRHRAVFGLRCIRKLPTHPDGGPFRAVLRRFPLQYTKYSCGKTTCPTQKFLTAGHIASFQIHPGRQTPDPGTIMPFRFIGLYQMKRKGDFL